MYFDDILMFFVIMKPGTCFSRRREVLGPQQVQLNYQYSIVDLFCISKDLFLMKTRDVNIVFG